MKRVLVIIALLGVMLALGAYHVDDVGGPNPVTLAAIGFVVLASFATAELGNAWTLPRVTGYILAGAVLGPSAANILSKEVVVEMKMFNTLALGLIATSAGLELDFRQLLPLLRTLGATIAIKVVFSVSLVGLTLLGVAQVMDLGVGTQPSHTWALAIVMGVLAIGTSPSIALAVLAETRAKGRLSELVLGAAIFKDFVVVVALALGVAVARTLLVPTATLEPEVLWHVAKELGGSLLAGAVLGMVLIAYVRFIKAEMLLFVAAMILVVAELCRVFHLELLLVFIAAGFVVRNFSKYEHDLMTPLELVALPVFVVFFTIAGAGIDLATTWQILPAALALCAARAASYWVAAHFGSSWGGESEAVRKNAWSAYLPQAGVTLGLVGLASQKLPEIAVAISNTGMAVVAINLLIGPIALRRALSKAGELPESQVEIEDRESPDPAVTSERPSVIPKRGPVELQSAELRRSLEQLREHNEGTLERFIAEGLKRSPSLPATTDNPTLEDFRRFVQAYRRASRALFDEMVASLSDLKTEERVLEGPEELRALPGDSRSVRFALWQKRMVKRVLGRDAARPVPVRLAARLTLERVYAELAQSVYERSVHHRFAERGEAETEDARDDAAQMWRETLADGFVRFAELLRDSGTVRLPTSALRFSSVEPEIRRALSALEEGREDFYATRVQAVWGSRLAQRHVDELNLAAQQATELHIIERAARVREKVGPAILKIVDRLSQVQEAGTSGTVPEVFHELLLGWRRDVEAIRGIALEEISREFRASAAMREVTSALRKAVAELPDSVRCFQVREEDSADSGTVRRVELRALGERDLIKGLIPTVDLAARAISNTFAQLPRRVRDVLDPSFLQLESLAESGGDRLGERLTEELRLAIHRLELVEKRAERLLKGYVEQIQAAVTHAVETLRADIEIVKTTGEPAGQSVQRMITAVREKITPWIDWFTRHGEVTRELNDATDLREALDRYRGKGLSEPARRWFSQEPVRDERIFTAQRSLLEALVDEEAAWIAGKRTAILVRGEVGAGKSSLLNMCELELRSARVLRLDAEGSEQSASLTDALALGLGCGQAEASLLRQMEVQHPVILVDNVDVWLSRSARPVHELDRLLGLVARTERSALWILAVEHTTLDMLEELATVSEVFTRVLSCDHLTTNGLQELVEARALRAGVQLEYRRTFVGRWLGRLGLGGDRELFFRTLAHTSHGNPGRALADCARCGVLEGTVLTLDGGVLRGRRGRIAQALTTTQLAVLLSIVRLGALDIGRLRAELGVPVAQLERNLSFLSGAGLLTAVGDRQTYEIPDSARWAIVVELRRLGALQ